jgi:hypothetical protein
MEFALKVNFQNLALLSTSIIIQLLYKTWDPKDDMNWCCVFTCMCWRDLGEDDYLQSKYVLRVDGNKGYSCANRHVCWICTPHWLYMIKYSSLTQRRLHSTTHTKLSVMKICIWYDKLRISVSSSTSKSPKHNGKKISGSFKKWVCAGHELNLGCELCMGFPH